MIRSDEALATERITHTKTSTNKNSRRNNLKQTELYIIDISANAQKGRTFFSGQVLDMQTHDLS
jgi:hypothetical protein